MKKKYIVCEIRENVLLGKTFGCKNEDVENLLFSDHSAFSSSHVNFLIMK